MYVDNTDLLHWAPTQVIKDDELIDYVQIASDDWGQLAHATGGILKQEKCSIYFMCY